MIKLINNNISVLTAGQIIPFNLKFSTNNNIKFDSVANALEYRKAGKYKIDVNIPVTATAVGEVTIALYNNGVIIPETQRTFNFTTVGDKATYVINDIESVILDILAQDYARITVVTNAPCSVINTEVVSFEIR